MFEIFGIIDRTYLLADLLGKGGMGAVFRATELVNQQSVALKLVTLQDPAEKKPTSPSQVDNKVSLRLDLAREFQTLASLHHPNIIRVLSYGFDELRGPYYTMELLPEPQTIVEAGLGRSDIGKIGLCAQLLRALAYIHRRGILHRDVKPTNVLVVDEEVKLLDFGIAAQKVDTSNLEMAGTVAYMAPELLVGTAPRVSSDIYAAGLIVHQMLTGRLPGLGLTGSSSSATMTDEDGATRTVSGLSSTTEPERNLSINGRLELMESALPQSQSLTESVTVDGPLGDVLRWMLDPDPDLRPQSAEEALAALAEAIGEPIPTETRETRESFLRATVLIGRDQELAALRLAVIKLKQKQGAGFLIGGESGVGKSRLISELRTLALVYGCWVAEGQGLSDGGTYFHEWTPLLRALCFRSELSDSEAASFRPLIPEIAELLNRPIPELPPAKPEELPGRLAASLRDVLARLSRPLVIILEDLHWARPESIALLASLSKEIAGLPVLLVGNFRSEERPELPQQLSELAHIHLARLGHAEIGSLSESMLGAVGSQPALIDYLSRQTEGNVFFLIEILRALAENAGELRLIGQGALPDSILTSGIKRIIERRVDHVDPSFRPVLEFAATLGRQLDLVALENAFPQLHLRSMLLQGANAAVLESQGSGWRFAHDKLRETLLNRMSAARRSTLHQQVAETLTASYSGDERERISGQIAHHFMHAGQPERAVPYFIQAGDRAVRLSVLVESRNYYQAALRVLDGLTAAPEQRRAKIDLLFKLMRSSLASDPLAVHLQRAQDAQELLDSLAGEQGLTREDQLRQVRLEYHTSRAYHYVGQLGEAIKRYRQILPKAREFEDPELTAMPSAVIGMALIMQGYVNRALPMLDGAVAPLSLLGNHLETIRCIAYLGAGLAMNGQYSKGLQVLADAEKRARSFKQQQLVFVTDIMSAIAYRHGMNWQEIVERSLRLGAACEKAGETTYTTFAWSSAAWAYAHLGEHAEARRLRKQALENVKSHGGKYLTSDWFIAGDSEAALLAGEPAEALEIASGLAATSTPAALPQSRALAERVLAVARHRLGAAREEVEGHFEQSLRILKSCELRLDIAQTSIWWGEVCAEHGETDAAQQHFAVAQRYFSEGGCEPGLAELARRRSACGL